MDASWWAISLNVICAVCSCLGKTHLLFLYYSLNTYVLLSVWEFFSPISSISAAVMDTNWLSYSSISSDTIYLELASDSTGKKLTPIRLPHLTRTWDTDHKSRLIPVLLTDWLDSRASRDSPSTPTPQVLLISLSSSHSSRKLLLIRLPVYYYKEH